MNIETLKQYNAAYRAGQPLVSDAEYDSLHAELRAAHSNDPFFSEPEPEAITGERVKHLQPMLSTEKAYASAEVATWAARAIEAAGGDPDRVVVRVTPKLDGIAAYVVGESVAYTRGKGGYGSNLLPLFAKGYIASSDRAYTGAGEIVVGKEYFDEVLAAEYGLTHPRNFVAGFVSADTIEDYHRRAIEDKAVQFVPYADLTSELLPVNQLVDTWESLFDKLIGGCQYLCDGLVAEIIDEDIKARLGSTSHHHRWQIALKRNDAAVSARVKGVRYTAGRTGRICPTAELEPVSLYGVTITWATAHNHKRMVDWGIGPGATVEIVRSGGVIPKIQMVTQPVVVTPEMTCPSCGTGAEMRGPTAFCPNTVGCPAQAAARLQHFFRTIGTCRGFGPTVCTALADAGFIKPSQVFGLSFEQAAAAGISPGIYANLAAELSETLTRPVSEAYFLAAMGIPNLGRGDSRKILEVHDLESLGGITASQIADIHGFAEKTATSIASDLRALWPEIQALLGLGWTLDRVRDTAATASGGSLAGMTVVFTGAMTLPRQEMEAQARRLGATVGSSVSAKTTLLVCGDKVGATKTDKARKLGVRVMSEAEYCSEYAS